MLVALIAALAFLGHARSRQPSASTVSSLSALETAVRNAPAGGTVYLAGGTYGSVTLNRHRKTWVTVRPVPGNSVHLADLNFGSNASHIAVRRFQVDGDVDLAPTGADHIQIFDSDLSGVSAKWGTNHIRIVHNWIHDCSNCIELVSTASNVPGAPDPSATDLPPVRNIKIVGNRIARPNTDAIFMGNYRHIRVEGNEITGVIENGNHNDALQSVYGGDDLVFRGNYVHDNYGQGFFIKDGRATNIEVSNNLFVRTTGPLWQLQLYRTIGAVIKRNTAWNSRGAVHPRRSGQSPGRRSKQRAERHVRGERPAELLPQPRGAQAVSQHHHERAVGTGVRRHATRRFGLTSAPRKQRLSHHEGAGEKDRLRRRDHLGGLGTASSGPASPRARRRGSARSAVSSRSRG